MMFYFKYTLPVVHIIVFMIEQMVADTIAVSWQQFCNMAFD